MKNIYFAFALVLFTFLACSTNGSGDGDGSGTSSGGGFGNRSSSSRGSSPTAKPGACDLKFTPMENYLDLCFQGITNSLTRNDCKEFLEYMNDDMPIPDAFTVEYINASCTEKGYKCRVIGDDGEEGYVYLYGDYYDRNSCREMFEGELVATPSSNSRASSSSNGGGSDAGVCYIPDFGKNSDLGIDLGACFDPTNRAQCQLINSLYGFDTEFKTSCPAKPDLKCFDNEDNMYISFYGEIKDETGRSATCKDLGYDSGTNTNKSSSSAGSGSKSSSSAANSTSGACYVYYEDEDDGSVEWGFCIKPTTSSECNSFQDEEDDAIIRFSDSCPSSAPVTCRPSGGRNIYFYGYDADPEDCDNINIFF